MCLPLISIRVLLESLLRCVQVGQPQPNWVAISLAVAFIKSSHLQDSAYVRVFRVGSANRNFDGTALSPKRDLAFFRSTYYAISTSRKILHFLKHENFIERFFVFHRIPFSNGNLHLQSVSFLDSYNTLVPLYSKQFLRLLCIFIYIIYMAFM